MKRKAVHCVAVAWFLAGASAQAANLGTAITYQGDLAKLGQPVTDTCIFKFNLWDDETPGTPDTQIGGDQTLTGVSVTNGLFIVNDLDFGQDAFNGTGRWLAIEVQCTGDPSFVPLSPRVALTPTPHALALPGLYTQQNSTSPNIIGGYIGNTVSSGVVGATISGGGSIINVNSASGDYATVSGGRKNIAGSDYATVAGGVLNSASGLEATVGGGAANKALGENSTVPGGGGNHAGGAYSFAAGFAANVRDSTQSGDADGDEGTFTWADSSGILFFSTGPDQFLIRAGGGVGINTNSPSAHLTINALSDGRPGLQIDNPGDATGSVRIDSPGGYPGVIGYANGGHRRDIRFTDQGISLLAQDTTGSPSTTDGIILNEFGLVGIGDDTPLYRLDVDSSDAAVAAFNRTGSDGAIINLQQDGSTVGSISVSGSTVSYNQFTGSHLGWTEEAIERGVLVVMTGDNRRRKEDPGSEPFYGIAASNVANDPKCLGAYLGLVEPAQAASLENPHQIMAVGNGDMWVVDTGRNIEPGQYLISSDIKGHAMLDDAGRFPIGYVIARAGERVDWAKVSEAVDGHKHKRISVFFESFERGNVAGVQELYKLVKDQRIVIDALQSRIDSLEGTASRGIVKAGLPLVLLVWVGLVALRRRSVKGGVQ